MKILKSQFLTMTLSTCGLMAQGVPLEELTKATLNSDFYLTLDIESPVSNYYYVDISHLDFANEAGFDPYNFHVTVYNRYGEVVFEYYKATGGWDGTYGYAGIVQAGTYTWSIEFKEADTDRII